MPPVSFKRHRFPQDVIRRVVCLHFRLTLSFRDVGGLLAQRGIEVSHETVRCWTLKFGRAFASFEPKPIAHGQRGRLSDRSLPAHCAFGD
jgi:transposase-like protein